jgi:DNA-binding CsgD family transcriptional regulator
MKKQATAFHRGQAVVTLNPGSVPKTTGFVPAMRFNRPPRALTVKQTCVALMVATGLSDKAIGYLLDTTEACIGNEIRKICEKTGTESKLALACWYAKRHLTERIVCVGLTDLPGPAQISRRPGTRTPQHDSGGRKGITEIPDPGPITFESTLETLKQNDPYPSSCGSGH